MHRKNKGAANKPFLFLRKVMAHFEVGFEILPGTKAREEAKVAKKGPFKQDLRQINE